MKESNPQMVELELTLRDVINAHILSDGITIGELVGVLDTIKIGIVVQDILDKQDNKEDEDD